MPRIFNVEQGTPEWFELRRGVITATRAQELLAVTKAGKPTSKREDAICEIAMERLNHSGKPQITGNAIRRGHEYESEAIDAYIFKTGQFVEPCGFALHDKYDVFGCSPDGLIAEAGMVQIKVPTSVKKHVGCLLNAEHATEYQFQLLHEMYVMKREWTDVVSYNPESPPELQLAIERLYAPDSWAEYEGRLMAADNAIKNMVTSLSNINLKKEAA